MRIEDATGRRRRMNNNRAAERATSVEAKRMARPLAHATAAGNSRWIRKKLASASQTRRHQYSEIMALRGAPVPGVFGECCAPVRRAAHGRARRPPPPGTKP